jgi:DNA-binding beta-propeller fold protein YncE
MKRPVERVLEAIGYASGGVALAFYLSVTLGVAFSALLLLIAGYSLIIVVFLWLIPVKHPIQGSLFAVLLLIAWGYIVYGFHAEVTDPTVETVAGTGSIGGADGAAAGASFYMPYDVEVVSGSAIVAEHWGGRIRRIDSSRKVTTLAAREAVLEGSEPYHVAWLSGPTRPQLPPLGYPTSVTATNLGERLYISDAKYHKIWVVERAASGYEMRTLAGTGQVGYVDALPGGTGLSSVSFDTPEDVVSAISQNVLYVLESGNRCVRRLALRDGTSSCYAGNQPLCERFLPLVDPGGMDYQGEVMYLVDAGGHRVWILAGNAEPRSIGTGVPGHRDGSFEEAQFNYPADVVAIAERGELYVADWGNRCIRRIDLREQVVETVAGQPGSPGHRDGAGRFARFHGPCGLAIDGKFLYIADFEDQRIRKVELKARRRGME